MCEIDARLVDCAINGGIHFETIWFILISYILLSIFQSVRWRKIGSFATSIFYTRY